ncbi:LapA family protein [Arthrobacter sp. TMS1-12-1]
MTGRNEVKGTSRANAPRRRLTGQQITAIVLVVLAVIFIAQNRAVTSISLLFLTVSLPLWITLTVATVIGIVVGWMLRRRSA